MPTYRTKSPGFSLIELLLALAILGVVSYFIVTLTNSVRHGGKVGETRQRMEVISAKMKEYYRHQGELPDWTNITGVTEYGEVPVNKLNLEAKFRFDGFGQIIRFYRDTDIVRLNVDGILDASNDIDGGTNVAGVLVSSGGDQNFHANTIRNSNDRGNNTLFVAHGDDIVTGVNVNREAMEIALDEVRELQRRVNQFDGLFRGSDACSPAADPSIGGCNPGTNPVLTDVNCGTATLDQIENSGALAANNYGCVNDAFNRDSDFRTAYNEPPAPGSPSNAGLKFIVGYYALGNNYLLDPWGNPYQWGCARQDASTPPVDLCGNDGYWPFDPRYRKFFSAGPNGLVDDGPSGDATGYTLYTTRADIDIVDDIIP